MKKWALLPAVAYMFLINILLVGSPAEDFFSGLAVHFPIAVVIFLVVWRRGGVKKWALLPAVAFILLTFIFGLLSSYSADLPFPLFLAGFAYSVLAVQFPMAVVIFLMVWGIGSLGRRLVKRH